MNREKLRIYILVKTYPTISKEYSELVCTAGILEDGSWIRLYPVPFRKLDLDQQYPKYTWVNLEATRNLSDFRPETYRPIWDTIKVEEKPKKKKVDWEKRREIILSHTKIYTDMSQLIKEAKEQTVSLAIFKPTKIIDFKYEEVDREWDPDKVAILQSLSKQLNLFQSAEEIEKEFEVVKKVPYKFSYVFEDCNGKRSTMMIEDWETGMLFFNCLKASNGDESIALQNVKKKYLDKYKGYDLHFFLGTTKAHHNVSKNPFIIIGAFAPPYPPGAEQLKLF